MNKVRMHIDTLCSPYMGGRGYVDEGEKRAGDYLSNCFEKYGLIAFDDTKNYQQKFKITVNRFPKPLIMKVNGNDMVVGKDFLPAPSSGSTNGETKMVYVPTMMHSMAMHQEPNGIVLYNDSNLIVNEVTDISIEAELEKKYTTRNVIGFVPGTSSLDSFIVFCGHYDHLGKIGPDVYFPGANDNASGTAMLLALAEYFYHHPQRYSIAFMAFGAEEVGLLGSKHYVENPLFPLNQIKFVVNLDILGGGDDGIQVVNGRKHQTEFDQLVTLNEKGNYLPLVKIRGASNNSDHAPFDAKGVPAFFIYTLGGATHYHDIDDKPEFLTLAGFEGLYNLLIDFTTELQTTE